jgi:WD repeat-containing protein 23
VYQAKRASQLSLSVSGGILTRSQIIGLLSRQDLGRILFADADEDDEYDPRARYARRRGARRPSEPLDPDRFPKVPDEEGQKLMDSGNFGTSPVGLNGKKRIARRVMEREIGIGSRATQWDSQRLMAQVSVRTREPMRPIRAVGD